MGLRNKGFRNSLAGLLAFSSLSFLISCQPLRFEFRRDGLTVYVNTKVLEVPVEVEKRVEVPCPERGEKIVKIPEIYDVGGLEYTCPDVYNALHNDTFEDALKKLREAESEDEGFMEEYKKHRKNYH